MLHRLKGVLLARGGRRSRNIRDSSPWEAGAPMREVSACYCGAVSRSGTEKPLRQLLEPVIAFLAGVGKNEFDVPAKRRFSPAVAGSLLGTE